MKRPVETPRNWTALLEEYANLREQADRADERERYERVRRLADRWRLGAESRAYGETLLTVLGEDQP